MKTIKAKHKTPLAYAIKVSNTYSAITKDDLKKGLGQYFTPIEIAKKMADITKPIRKEVVNILDPGCGTAILTCALLEKLLTPKSPIKEINLDLYEIDDSILDSLEDVIENLVQWAKSKGVLINLRICHADFILTESIEENRRYDVVITNPPYFKLPKRDLRSILSSEVVHGQPNIYSIFLAKATDKLTIDGQLIFITPRSFTSGKYFRKFREYFFDKISIKNIHIFESRSDTFKKDDVLQETVIMKGVSKTKRKSKITITRSQGIHDINENKPFTCFEFEILNMNSVNKTLFIPASNSDLELINRLSRFVYNFDSLDIKVSTGPVVYFRNEKGLRKYSGEQIVPLIWLNNIYSMRLEWPNKRFEKEQNISSLTPFDKVLVENKNYVLVRRFSAKGDTKRLVAAPFFKQDFREFESVGIENKVNYIRKEEREFDHYEIIGLSALLSSITYNNYFVVLNGNTNVSVNDLNQLPLPSLESIQELGKKAVQSNEQNIEIEINKLLYI